MNQRLEPSSAPTEQSEGRAHVALRLSECGDTLSIREVCGVLGISPRQLRHLRQHRAFIEPVRGLSHRWSNSAVQRFLDGQGQKSLRRVG